MSNCDWASAMTRRDVSNVACQQTAWCAWFREAVAHVHATGVSLPRQRLTDNIWGTEKRIKNYGPANARQPVGVERREQSIMSWRLASAARIETVSNNHHYDVCRQLDQRAPSESRSYLLNCKFYQLHIAKRLALWTAKKKTVGLSKW